MAAPEIAARRLALLLLLPACHTWRPVSLAPDTDFGRGAAVRLELTDRSTDSVALSGHGSARVTQGPVVFVLPRVVGDSLFGHREGSSSPSAVALADVRRAEHRRFSLTRTTLLVVGVGGLGVAIAAGLNDQTESGRICGPAVAAIC